MSATIQSKKLQRTLLRLLAGAIFGAAGSALFFLLIGDPYMRLEDPAVMLATTTGLIYALIGVSVAIGLVSPQAGARFLNVEDAEELREERPKLRSAAAACLLIGLLFLLLAIAASDWLVSREIALLLAAACLVAAIVLTVLNRKRTDELTRQIGLEASAFTVNAALIGLAVWTGLAELGYVGPLNPLALVSTLALLQLIAIMGAGAARGVMTR